MRASRADLVFRSLDTRERTADYCIALDFGQRLNPEEFVGRLMRGAEAARVAFPKVGMVLRGKRWVEGRGPEAIRVVRGPRAGAEAALDEFNRPPLAVRSCFLRQLVYVAEDTGHLSFYSRFHHSLGDGASAFMFLQAQLMVAFDRSPPPVEAAPLARIRRHPAPIWRSPFAYDRPATQLAPRETVGGGKHFRIQPIPSPVLRAFVDRNQRRFKYNDLLLVLIVEALRRWPARPEGELFPQVMLPMNTRETAFEGFGNIAAMVSIYADGRGQGSYAERALAVRKQVDWARENGAWHRPPEGPLFRAAPFFVIRSIVRLLARRGGATLVFSHLERQSESGWEHQFPELERVFIVSPLVAAAPLMFAVTTFRDTTHLCATFRERPLRAEAVEQLLELCKEVASEIAREAIEPAEREVAQP